MSFYYTTYEATIRPNPRAAAAAAQEHACFREGGTTRGEYAALGTRGERLLGHGRPRMFECGTETMDIIIFELPPRR